MKCVKYVKLFDNGPKNRRRNAKEWEEELLQAKLFKRPPTPMLLDPPFYPYFPPTPIANQKLPLINFDLGFKQ